MSAFMLSFNSKSRASNIEVAKRMLKDIKNCDIKDDGQYFTISGSEISKNIYELYLIVEQWKGSELKVNGKVIKNHWYIESVISCNRKSYCNGECIYLEEWNTIFSFINNKNEIGEFTISEEDFYVDDHPEILIESDDQYFSIYTKFLKDDFIEYCKTYLDVCPRFKKEKYLDNFKNIKNIIKIKRINYSDVQENREKRSEIELNEGMEVIINRMGDEFEKRIRKVLDEYFSKKKTT